MDPFHVVRLTCDALDLCPRGRRRRSCPLGRSRSFSRSRARSSSNLAAGVDMDGVKHLLGRRPDRHQLEERPLPQLWDRDIERADPGIGGHGGGSRCGA